MNNFINYLRETSHPERIGHYTEYGMHDVVYYISTSETLTFTVHDDKLQLLSPQATRQLWMYAKYDFNTKLQVFLYSQVFGKGPKVFKPTVEQLEALEKMTINIDIKEFHTPFETTVIEFPDEYLATRRVTDRLMKYGIIFKRDDVLFTQIMDQSIGVQSYMKGLEDLALVEDWLISKTEYTYRHPNGSEEIIYVDEDNALKLKRAMLNYCLLLDEVGIRRCGPESINNYNQLVKWCKKNNKHTARNKIALQAEPIIYTLDKRPVNLIRIEEDNSVRILNTEEGEKRKVVSHWRRGHYRMQPCGPKSSERKRIRVPPVLVNKNQLIIGADYKT